MVGALIDMGNPIVPFIGGILVGGLVAPPLMGAVGDLLGGMLGNEADAAYAYHAYKRGKMGGMRAHKHMGHGMMHPGMMHHGMPTGPIRPPARRKDFEKEYNSVEQTYTNQIAIRR